MEAETATTTAETGSIELTVVVPTFNERENVPLLVERLDKVLAGTAWEVVVVDDDSPDGTADVARAIARRNQRVRVIRRVGRRGLSTACVEGVMSSSAPYFAVIDGDLQHDEKILPEMLRRLKSDNLDIVIGSRYSRSGDSDGLAGRSRRLISRLGGRVARLILNAELTDPMSGFFMASRASFDEVVRRLSQQGFKILLDIFASASRPLRFAEVPYRFGARHLGQSKLDTMAAWEFGILILDKLLGRYLPVRFVVFAGVGLTGIVAHLATMGLAAAAGFGFQISQATAVIVAMTWNFVLNNLITYRDERLRGTAFLRGLASFYAISAIGAVANVGIADMLFRGGSGWWLAGIAGALMGVVWNYTMSSIFTWRRRTVA